MILERGMRVFGHGAGQNTFISGTTLKYCSCVLLSDKGEFLFSALDYYVEMTD